MVKFMSSFILVCCFGASFIRWNMLVHIKLCNQGSRMNYFNYEGLIAFFKCLEVTKISGVAVTVLQNNSEERDGTLPQHRTCKNCLKRRSIFVQTDLFVKSYRDYRFT